MSAIPSPSPLPSRRPSASVHHNDDSPLHRDANEGRPIQSPFAPSQIIRGSSSSSSSSRTSTSASVSAPQNTTLPTASSSSPTANESILRFLLLPSQVGIVLLLEFLNSFRSFGLRFLLYNYITNEFGIGDTQAGVILGIKGFVDIAFGLAGSILVDILGVRRVSVVALSVAIIGRSLLAFGRSRSSLYLALFFFSPCGDALLSVGLYRVALKKLTTPLTRPFAFAMSYASFNLAGACATILMDKMRSHLEDLTIDKNVLGVGGVFTPLRQFVVVTWGVVLLTFVIAYCFLEDWTVIDLNDPEDGNDIQEHNHPETNNNETTEEELEGHYVGSITDRPDLKPVKPMVKPHLLKRWFPSHYQSVLHGDDENQHQYGNNDEGEESRRLPNYNIYRTQYTRSNEGNTSPFAGVMQVINQIIALLRMRSTWRVLIFGFASFTIAMNWTAGEMILPPFLERRFGEEVPIYTIQSINLIGCLILPPIVGATTSGREDFSIIMPGLWIMASSSVFVAMFPSAAGACVWQVFITVGEVLWSPRQISWTASLAPSGSEGLFFAISSARQLMAPLADFMMGAINEKYNPNCPDCRDNYGHFCGNLFTENDESSLQCVSVQESCDLFLDNMQQSCPQTCIQCPSWEHTNPSTCWYLLLLVSLVTPISVWFFLPFLRGKYNRNESFYGLFSLTKKRFLGVCGALDNQDNRHRVQTYGHVESESSDSQAEKEDIGVVGEDGTLVEIT